MPLTNFSSPDVREWLSYNNFVVSNKSNNTGRMGEFLRNAGTGYTQETISLWDISSLLFHSITNVDLEYTCNSKGGQTIGSNILLHRQNKSSPVNWLGTNIDFDTPFAVSAWPSAMVSGPLALNTGTYTQLNTASFLAEVQSWLTSQPANNWGLISAINFGAVGWYLSLDGLTLKVTHTAPVNTPWGMRYLGYDNSLVNFCRFMGGTSPTPSAGKKLVCKSVSVYVGSTHSNQVRLAIYQGGTIGNPVGATLVYDFGLTSGSGLNQWLTVSHPGAGVDLAGNTPTWIGIKGNDSGFRYHYTNDSGKSQDMQSANGRWNSTSMSTLDGVAWESSISSGGSFGGAWYGLVLQYAEEDAGGSVALLRRRRDLVGEYT